MIFNQLLIIIYYYHFIYFISIIIPKSHFNSSLSNFIRLFFIIIILHMDAILDNIAYQINQKISIQS
jgi:hypothetical protein